MKIAVASNDGILVSQHFGQAAYYVVFTLDDGRITGREVRVKAHHLDNDSLDRHAHGHDSHHHGSRLHHQMAASIADCAVVLVGGIGRGAYNSLREEGITPLGVQAADVEDAVLDYLAGRTIDDIGS